MEPGFKTEGTCLTIILPGEVDHPVSDYVRRTADRIMEKIYIKTIEFDFSETTFMDSSGIGLIMGRYRTLGMCTGCIRAVHVNRHIEKILRISGVSKFMEISRESEAV